MYTTDHQGADRTQTFSHLLLALIASLEIRHGALVQAAVFDTSPGSQSLQAAIFWSTLAMILLPGAIGGAFYVRALVGTGQDSGKVERSGKPSRHSVAMVEASA